MYYTVFRFSLQYSGEICERLSVRKKNVMAPQPFGPSKEEFHEFIRGTWTPSVTHNMYIQVSRQVGGSGRAAMLHGVSSAVQVMAAGLLIKENQHMHRELAKMQKQLAETEEDLHKSKLFGDETEAKLAKEEDMRRSERSKLSTLTKQVSELQRDKDVAEAALKTSNKRAAMWEHVAEKVTHFETEHEKFRAYIDREKLPEMHVFETEVARVISNKRKIESSDSEEECSADVVYATEMKKKKEHVGKLFHFGQLDPSQMDSQLH